MASRQFIRVYEHLVFEEIKEHALEYGALSGVCAKCKTMNIRLEDPACPSCKTAFNYIAFQNIREHLPKMLRLQDIRRGVRFIDYQDFKRIEGELKARSILG